MNYLTYNLFLFNIFPITTSISFLNLTLNFVATLLFIMGVLIINFNFSNLLISLMGIELILLGCNINFLIPTLSSSVYEGYVYTLFTLTVSAIETAIGISILILYYSVNKTVNFKNLNTLKI